MVDRSPYLRAQSAGKFEKDKIKMRGEASAERDAENSRQTKVTVTGAPGQHRPRCRRV
jgi:hypothetical protein